MYVRINGENQIGARYLAHTELYDIRLWRRDRYFLLRERNSTHYDMWYVTWDELKDRNTQLSNNV